MLPDVEHIGGLVAVAEPRPPSLPSSPPMLFPSFFFSTREMAFVLVYGIVHHSGTKRLNQVA